MNRAACTIASANYLPYVRTLCDSFKQYHPDYKFYVLLVDRPPQDFDLSSETFEVILAEDLVIPDFKAVAFKFGVVELNTNVKPTFLKKILDMGIDQLIYFDPDIFVCSSTDVIYRALAENSILLTPHATSPSTHNVYDEVLLLLNGAYNLGFIAVSNTRDAREFLSWWEDRCLTLGYNERWSGLFVDQKWINLVPCFFNFVKIFKHSGCNVAYWNLHERYPSRSGASWAVNGSDLLVFFHFSGVSADGGNTISKHSDQFDLESRPELKPLFDEYRQRLIQNGIRNNRKHTYAYGYFDNGRPINKLQRALFAANLHRFGSTDPFAASGPFYQWATKMHTHSDQDSVTQYGRKAYSHSDRRVQVINKLLKLMCRVIGADRYTILMKYLEYISTLRNQKDIFQ